MRNSYSSDRLRVVFKASVWRHSKFQGAIVFSPVVATDRPVTSR